MNGRCIFKNLPEPIKKDEPVFECIHGVMVSWTPARAALGLPKKPLKEEPDADTTLRP